MIVVGYRAITWDVKNMLRTTGARLMAITMEMDGTVCLERLKIGLMNPAEQLWFARNVDVNKVGYDEIF